MATFKQNQEQNQEITNILNAIRTNEVLELIPLENKTFNECYSMHYVNQPTKTGVQPEYAIVWGR
jgi:cytochrome c2